MDEDGEEGHGEAGGDGECVFEESEDEDGGLPEVTGRGGDVDEGDTALLSDEPWCWCWK